jgi:hypothetical protein
LNNDIALAIAFDLYNFDILYIKKFPPHERTNERTNNNGSIFQTQHCTSLALSWLYAQIDLHGDIWLCGGYNRTIDALLESSTLAL